MERLVTGDTPLETFPGILSHGGNPRGLVKVRTPPHGSYRVRSTGWCQFSTFCFKMLLHILIYLFSRSLKKFTVVATSLSDGMM